MSLDPVAGAIQNFDLRIALGIALRLLFSRLLFFAWRRTRFFTQLNTVSDEDLHPMSVR